MPAPSVRAVIGGAEGAVSHWTVANALIGLALAACGPYGPDRTNFPCSERKAILAAVSAPQAHKIYVTVEATGLEPKEDWCPASDIELLPFSESGLDVTYAVRCKGEPKFNIRLIKREDVSVRYSVEPYKEATARLRAETCP